MDAMQGDDNEEIIDAMITAADDFRRSNRYPPDHQVLSVVPDWLYARLNDRERDRFAKHSVIVRSHTQEYGPEE